MVPDLRSWTLEMLTLQMGVDPTFLLGEKNWDFQTKSRYWYDDYWPHTSSRFACDSEFSHIQTLGRCFFRSKLHAHIGMLMLETEGGTPIEFELWYEQRLERTSVFLLCFSSCPVGHNGWLGCWFGRKVGWASCFNWIRFDMHRE